MCCLRQILWLFCEEGEKNSKNDSAVLRMKNLRSYKNSNRIAWIRPFYTLQKNYVMSYKKQQFLSYFLF